MIICDESEGLSKEAIGCGGEMRGPDTHPFKYDKPPMNQ